LHLGENESLVGEYQMSDQEWLESIIKVRNQSKVIQRNESNQLHVLNKSPKRKETNLSEEEYKELEPDDTT